MKKKYLLIALLALGAANAEVIPNIDSNVDERIRTMDYTRDVIKLNTLVGVSSHVEFGEDEQIEFLASGDDDAWHFAPKKNHLFIRPVATEFVDTNLTVLTNKHTYHFVLVQNKVNEADWANAWQDKNLVYSVKFKYPLEEAEKLAQKQAEERLKRNENAKIAQLKADKLALRKELDRQQKEIQNRDYWAAGDREITPIETYDNGTFTFFRFQPNAPIPAFYSVDKHGNEAIVNTTMVGTNMIKIQGVFKMMRIRHGSNVVCVDNRGTSIYNQTDTNTTSPNVVRQTRRAM